MSGKNKPNHKKKGVDNRKIHNARQSEEKAVSVATASALSEMGFAHNRIAEIMNVAPETISRYVNSELADGYQDFAQAIKKVYLERDFALVNQAMDQISKKMPDARFFELTGLVKTLREVRVKEEGEGKSLVNIDQRTVNVHPALLDKYGAMGQMTPKDDPSPVEGQAEKVETKGDNSDASLKTHLTTSGETNKDPGRGEE